MELRAPFLDHMFTSYVFSLPPEKRAPTQKRLEKHIIRKAFNGLNVVPQEIIWQPNVMKSEGVSNKSFLPKVLKDHAAKLVILEALIIVISINFFFINFFKGNR